uniref:Helitron helicase-like domain-containing protein n=1 Tax=Cacopsylla melanoneura TaxID=428564 RepID=A0A8D8QFU6_9HEMI
MNVVCPHCKALKYENESPGLCCASGKVKLAPLVRPPEPLYSLVSGTGSDSKHFLTHIQNYNNCFQMTSFGATKVVQENFMPTFKIQGQIYHRVGPLLPTPNGEHKFLQIYFMGNSPQEVDQRCLHNRSVKRPIVEQLQNLFHEHNQLITLFKTALDRMPSNNHKIVIRADKTPSGGHAGRFNAPTIDEVAVVIVGENLESRDIVLQQRNDQMQRVRETHRSYDALQYPIIFWQGEDGYHFSIKMINPLTGAETNKKVSSMNYYSYRLMVRQNEENHILKCRRLFHQYAVDMYVKIETERLTYIRLNQTQLRSEQYIHLRDALNCDANAQDVGRMTILPATYVGSPRHMHEYAQDAMSYVRHYGTADLFITFTCNPQWIEIRQELFSGQSPVDRHDITARVFKQKLKSLMDVIVKYHVFGKTRCWMYSVEWQKRGLPHSHILIWLFEKIRPHEIDHVISAEIPNVEDDPILHEVVTKNMIHGPCGTLNQNAPCMVDGICSKRYPRTLVAETITGNDGYPLYRRRSIADNGRSTIVKVNRQEIEVDNRWIVPYSPVLSKTFKAHINVESCHSVKSIKYICKYVTKGSDMAMIGISAENSNDEIIQYQMGRYVSSNEAMWRIFSFPIHERYPAVIHLAVHLENGQRVYFTVQNAIQRVDQPPSTTLTSFFDLCETDEFAQTLLYSEVPRYYTWVQSSKKWQRRKQGHPVPGHPGVFSTDTIGRIYTVHPNNDECFYLRLLLVNVHGPKSFQDIRTVNGETYVTYRDACQRLELLENDSHWEHTLGDAVLSSSPHQIRTLFAIILSSCFPSNPEELWNKYKNDMADDILHRMRRSGNPDLQFSAEIYNEALILIEDLCLMMSNKVSRRKRRVN